LKYDVKDECLVLISIRKLEAADVEEIKRFIKLNGFDLPTAIDLILARLRAKGSVTMHFNEGRRVYKMRRYRNKPMSMANVIRIRMSKELQSEIEDLKKKEGEKRNQAIKEIEAKILASNKKR